MLLGFATKHMSDSLRERMFADLGVDPDNMVLVEKCVEIVKKLKLEADVLTGKFREKFDEDELKMRKAEEEARKKMGDTV